MWKYTPSDLVDRGSGTLVCDLNRRPLPDLRHVAPNVAVFGGVLEYIRDVPGVIEWLAASGVSNVVASYDTVPAECGPIGRWRESLRRQYFGYMSSFRELELVRMFEGLGFSCLEKRVWTTQGIYRFAK
jgi:hypothetical protein